MPGNKPPVVPADVPRARRCECETPLCFTEDDGYCCRCGHLREPAAERPRDLVHAIAKIADR